MEIDPDRLREDIETTAQFGAIDADEGRGRTTLTGTDADKQARDYLVERMEDAGLSVCIDALGNIAGRWTPDAANPSADPVAAGSHLDSVIEGGIFDGPLGVYGALESVRAIQESDATPSRPLKIVSFTEEEGIRFKNGLLGSSVVTGLRDLDSALELTDDDGNVLGEELERIGYAGSDTIGAGDWHAWGEIHVEQDTTLKETNTEVGIIEAIAGLTNCRVEFSGETNHAGATPMDERHDALAAASECILSLEEIASSVVDSRSSTAVGTVGELHVHPNAKNTIAGNTELIIDARDVDSDAIDHIIDSVRESLRDVERERDVGVTFDQYRYTEPQLMSDTCIEASESAAAEQDISATRMHSPALHDTANVATVTDTVMLFAPSEGGLSHTPLEWTDWEDCNAVTRVLAETMRELAA
jgi:N-carbamoyl-L-amino-acid hydrolase